MHLKHTDGHFEHVPYFSLPANDLTDVIAPSCYSCFDYPNGLADLVSQPAAGPVTHSPPLSASQQAHTGMLQRLHVEHFPEMTSAMSCELQCAECQVSKSQGTRWNTSSTNESGFVYRWWATWGSHTTIPTW